jgi:hypothetical protein
MKISRAIAVLVLAAAACAVPTASGAAGVNPPSCVARAMKWVPPRHMVVLTCRDGSRQAGRIAEFDSTRGTLLFMPVAAGASTHALPATDVVRLEWRERGKPSAVAAVFGFAIGGIIGGAIAVWANSAGYSMSLNSGILITGLGAALGLVAGVEASSAWSQADYYAVDGRGDSENLPTRPSGRQSAQSPVKRDWL